MIYLILAILASMAVAVVMRLSEKHIRNNISMLASNYLMCCVLAGAYADVLRGSLAQAGIGLAIGEDGVLRAEFTRDDRTAWRDAAVAALEQSAQEDADETQS